MKLLEFLLKPLLDAQFQAGLEIGRAKAEAWNLARAQRVALEKSAGGNVLACVQYEEWLYRQRTASAPLVDDDTPSENGPTPRR